MGGGLLQLVAYGAQDIYLTGNPQITFFIAVYRRHTNFAIEAIEQTFNGNPAFGSRVTCTIARNGDLIHRVYLALDLSTVSVELCKFFGLRLIKDVEVEIGGQRIDKHFSHWMYIWNELSLPRSKKQGYYDMVGAYGGTPTALDTTPIQKKLYIPLEFWFCRNVGLALPLISLQYHEVKINLNFETAAKCKGSSTDLTSSNANFGASLWVDYIFLDTDERKRFAQLSHEYLIEQVQYNGPEGITNSQSKPKLTMNHPCKELYWFCTTDDTDQAVTNNNWMNYAIQNSSTKLVIGDTSLNAISKKLNPTPRGSSTATSTTSTSSNPIVKAKLVLNGNERFAERNSSYFNLVQPYQHHENIPMNAGLNVYSFALKPEEHQPSGTLNMSRIDSAALHLTVDNAFATANKSYLHVYAVNYNVLRIMSGMGGIAYSN
jgi:hypothetical protein